MNFYEIYKVLNETIDEEEKYEDTKKAGGKHLSDLSLEDTLAFADSVEKWLAAERAKPDPDGIAYRLKIEERNKYFIKFICPEIVKKIKVWLSDSSKLTEYFKTVSEYLNLKNKDLGDPQVYTEDDIKNHLKAYYAINQISTDFGPERDIRTPNFRAEIHIDGLDSSRYTATYIGFSIKPIDTDDVASGKLTLNELVDDCITSAVEHRIYDLKDAIKRIS